MVAFRYRSSSKSRRSLNASLAEEDTGLHIDTWDPETGVFTATGA